LAVNTWIATGAGNWGDIGNWSLGHVPTNTETATFDNTSDNNCNINVTVDCYGINITSGYDGTVAQGNVDMAVGLGDFLIAGGTFTAYVTRLITCAGDFTYSGGTITDDSLRLKMITDGKTATVQGGLFYHLFQASANVTLSHTSTTPFFNVITIDSGKTLTIASGKTITSYYYSVGQTLTNLGTINGPGSLTVLVYAGDFTYTFGTINATVNIILHGSAPTNRSVSLGANTTLGGDLSVSSNHASYTMSLLHGSNYTLSVTGLTTLSTRGIMTQGTGAWAFTGGYAQSGASSAFTQGGNVTVGAGGILLSSGTFTANTSYTITCGGSFTHSSGCTLTSSLVRIILTADGSTFQVATTNHIYDLTASANITVSYSSSIIQIRHNLTVDSGKTISVQSGTTFRWLSYWSGAYSNSGIISGSGNFEIYNFSTSPTVTFGAVNCPVIITLDDTAGADRTLSLGANASLGSTLLVRSYHDTYTMTLHHGTNYTLTVTGLTTLSTRGKMTQGTGAWTLTGGLAQNGASSVFTQGGAITVGNVSLTSGTFIPIKTAVIECTGNLTENGCTVPEDLLNIKMSGLNKSITITGNTTLNKLQASNNITLISSVRVYRYLTVDNGITITVNSGKVLYCDDSYEGTFDYSNLGIITGAGELQVLQWNSAITYTFGTVNCTLRITCYAATGGPQTVTLGANTTLGGALIVESLSATYTVSLLAGASNRTLTVAGLTTVGTRAVLTQGTGLWTFTGGLTVSGASSIFNEGENISVGGTGIIHSNGTFNGNISYLITNSGNYNQSGGTLTDNLLRLKMTGAGTTITKVSSSIFYFLQISANVTLASDSIVNGLTVDNGCTLAIGTKILTKRCYAAAWYTYSNLGSITATSGYVLLYFYDTDKTMDIGVVTNVQVVLHSAGTLGRTLFLSTNLIISGTLGVSSNHASYTMTLNHGTNYTLTVNGLTTIGTRGIATQGTGAWDFAGGLTQTVDSTFTQGGDLSIRTAWTHTNGTFTGSASYWIFQYCNLSKASGVITPNVIRLNASADISISSGALIVYHSITANNNITFTSAKQWEVSSGPVVIAAGKYISIPSGAALNIGANPAVTISNGGQFIGEGILRANISVDKTLTFGSVVCPLDISLLASASASRTLKLGASLVCASLIVQSLHASYVLNLDLDGFNLTATDYVIGTRGNVLGGEGLTVASGNVDLSLGIFTRETSIFKLTGVSKNLTCNATSACTSGFYDITIDTGASYTLQSDMWYWHTKSELGTLNLNGYTVFNCGVVIKSLDDSLGFAEIPYLNRPGIPISESLSFNESFKTNKGLRISEALNLGDIILRGRNVLMLENISLTEYILTSKSLRLTDALTIFESMIYAGMPYTGIIIVDGLTITENISLNKYLKVYETLTLVETLINNPVFHGSASWGIFRFIDNRGKIYGIYDEFYRKKSKD